MQKPNKSKQQKQLKNGKKKRSKQLKRNEQNKTKRLKRLLKNTQKRQIENETFKLEDEIRRIQNKGLTFRNPIVE
jgi:hypothetical protein